MLEESLQPKHNLPKIISFFSGAGFLDLGFEVEGFEIVKVNEYYRPFLTAYTFARERLGISPPRYGYFPNSILELSDDKYDKEISLYINETREAGNLIGFIGGPPCPDFSVGGKNRGRKGENGRLTSDYFALICRHQPDFFLFENVKGLWRTRIHRAFYEEMKQLLFDKGYFVAERLINAIEYGVPQDRERIILVGFRKNLIASLNVETSPSSIFPYVLGDDIFLWHKHINYHSKDILSLPWPKIDTFELEAKRQRPNGIIPELTVECWFRNNDVLNHPNAQHHFLPRAGLYKFLTVAEGDDSKKSYKRLHRWRYAPTAAYGNNEVHLHPYQARRISVAEALAIQSLPKEFELPPDMSLTNMFKTIGNGVPFLAARGLARTLKDFLDQDEQHGT